jgi:hypothetical protein
MSCIKEILKLHQRHVELDRPSIGECHGGGFRCFVECPPCTDEVQREGWNSHKHTEQQRPLHIRHRGGALVGGLGVTWRSRWGWNLLPPVPGSYVKERTAVFWCVSGGELRRPLRVLEAWLRQWPKSRSPCRFSHATVVFLAVLGLRVRVFDVDHNSGNKTGNVGEAVGGRLAFGTGTRRRPMVEVSHYAASPLDSAISPSIHSTTSASGHATWRGPSLTGFGNWPATIFRCSEVLDIPVRSRTLPTRMSLVEFSISTPFVQVVHYDSHVRGRGWTLVG